MNLFIIALSYSLTILGGYLMATKILGLRRQTIIKKCVGYTLFLDNNNKAYASKQQYLDFYKENMYAVLGFIYMIVGSILNIFIDEKIIDSKLKLMIIIFAEIVILGILTFLIVKLLCYIQNKTLKDYIKVDEKVIDNGAVAIYNEDIKGE